MASDKGVADVEGETNTEVGVLIVDTERVDIGGEEMIETGKGNDWIGKDNFVLSGFLAKVKVLGRVAVLETESHGASMSVTGSTMSESPERKHAVPESSNKSCLSLSRTSDLQSLVIAHVLIFSEVRGDFWLEHNSSFSITPVETESLNIVARPCPGMASLEFSRTENADGLALSMRALARVKN